MPPPGSGRSAPAIAVLRPPLPRRAGGGIPDSLYVAEALPAPPLGFGVGGLPFAPDLPFAPSPPFASSLPYPPDQPFPAAGQPPFAVPVPARLPSIPPRCPLIIKVGRGLASPARSRIVSGRPNCL